MPRLGRRSPAQKHEGLSPLLRIRLLTGEYYWHLDGSEVPDDELPGLWRQHREELLREHAEYQAARREAAGEFAFAYDQDDWDAPCWAELEYELRPRYGPRREGERWFDYYRRCGIAR